MGQVIYLKDRLQNNAEEQKEFEIYMLIDHFIKLFEQYGYDLQSVKYKPKKNISAK